MATHSSADQALPPVLGAQSRVVIQSIAIGVHWLTNTLPVALIIGGLGPEWREGGDWRQSGLLHINSSMLLLQSTDT
jgi:hypothetical protein